MPRHPRLNQIGRREATGGTETSQYPEEEKSNEIALVVASERAPAQTRVGVQPQGLCSAGVVGGRIRGPGPPGAVRNQVGSGTAWEGRRNRVRAPYANPSWLRRPSRVEPDT